MKNYFNAFNYIKKGSVEVISNVNNISPLPDNLYHLTSSMMINYLNSMWYAYNYTQTNNLQKTLLEQNYDDALSLHKELLGQNVPDNNSANHHFE